MPENFSGWNTRSEWTAVGNAYLDEINWINMRIHPKVRECKICKKKLGKIYTFEDKHGEKIQVCSHCKFIHDFIVKQVRTNKDNEVFIDIYGITHYKRLERSRKEYDK